MIRYLLLMLFFLFSSPVVAQEAVENLVLAKAPIDRSDMASIKRGARFFATNCIACHTLVYLRYDKVAQETGITLNRMPINVKDWPFGVKPPDLSLEASVRGVNWIYTYLHSFYQDSSRPTGVNNLLFPNTAMSAILAPYQGDQVLDKNKTNVGILYNDTNWYDLLILTRQGSMTPEQFDATVTDLVNFLAYAAEPFYQEQHYLGWWVLGFLAILFLMMYYLKQEYWKDVKKHKE
ncbi:MAG TPA: cytochrome c1 [Gammaproteobacteria bacterium]|nr:cytochrome c1 [Gammaproteobacteria bacterium]